MFEPYADVPGYPLALPIFWGSFAIFVLLMARRARVFTATRSAVPETWGDLGRRLAGLLRYAFVQTRMFRESRVGVMHYALFLGSTLLLIANIDIVTAGFARAVISWPLDGALWTAVLAIQNTVTLAVFAALAYMFYRRLVVRPSRLTLNRTGLLILTMISLVVSTEFFVLVFEAAGHGDIPGAYATNALGALVRPLGDAANETMFVGMWWAHVLVLSAFLLYIPTNKHFHVYTSFLNVWFRKLKPRGELPAMDLEDETGSFGVKTLADLGWKDLLDAYTCTECGRCQDACPAWATGKPLNPKTFIMGLRDMSEEVESGLNLIPNSPIVRETYGLDDSLRPEALAKPIVDDAIPYEAVWDCVTCGACVEACPVLIEHVDKIVGLRRNLVLEESRFPSELTAAFRNMEGPQNPWGQPPSTRTDWTKGLPFEVPTVAALAADGMLDEVEVLYWVGCAAAFDERNKRVARAVATCLDAAGVRFAILGQEESCTGDPARRMGNDYVYQILAAGNVETLNRYGMGERTIVTACPHCFNTIGNEYGQLGGTFRIEHHSVFLARLLEEGRLRLRDDGLPMKSVTYHDPCYLTRYNGIEAAPRDILNAAGLDLVEMDKHGRRTFCCGAGGGRMWMEEPRGTRINAERTRQALETGAEAVAVACPFCMVMLKDGLADSAAGDVSAIDIAEILGERAVRPAGRELPVLQ